MKSYICDPFFYFWACEDGRREGGGEEGRRRTAWTARWGGFEEGGWRTVWTVRVRHGRTRQQRGAADGGTVWTAGMVLPAENRRRWGSAQMEEWVGGGGGR